MTEEELLRHERAADDLTHLYSVDDAPHAAWTAIYALTAEVRRLQAEVLWLRGTLTQTLDIHQTAAAIHDIRTILEQQP